MNLLYVYFLMDDLSSLEYCVEAGGTVNCCCYWNGSMESIVLEALT